MKIHYFQSDEAEVKTFELTLCVKCGSKDKVEL